MESREKDGIGPPILNNGPGIVNNTSPHCDTCWHKAVTEINGVNLCRIHWEAYFGLSS